MLYLWIVRHAKSDWGDPGKSDHDRTLNDRGRNDAPDMAQRLLTSGLPVPEYMISSTAVRAITTAEIFAGMIGYPNNKVKREASIYEGDIQTLMKVVCSLPDQAGCVALFGHEPGVSWLVAHLTGVQLGEYPTCAMSCIEFSYDEWQLCSANSGRLIHFDFPKNDEFK